MGKGKRRTETSIGQPNGKRFRYTGTACKPSDFLPQRAAGMAYGRNSIIIKYTTPQADALIGRAEPIFSQALSGFFVTSSYVWKPMVGRMLLRRGFEAVDHSVVGPEDELVSYDAGAGLNGWPQLHGPYFFSGI